MESSPGGCWDQVQGLELEDADFADLSMQVDEYVVLALECLGQSVNGECRIASRSL